MVSEFDRGFTLIELLIVVAIISIVAAISVPGLLRARMTGTVWQSIGPLPPAEPFTPSASVSPIQ